MPLRSDAARSRTLKLLVVVGLLLVAGFGATLLIFYPGVMTFDARYVYQDIGKATTGDWQSPVMVWLWRLIDPLAPGAASMFLLTVATYWLGFGLIALRLASRGARVAVLLPLLAMTPPALAFAGIIWRDVLFATLWLLAAALAFIVTGRGRAVRWAGQGLAMALLVLGVLLRPNAVLAAPVLALYIVMLRKPSLRRLALVYVPAVLVFFATVQVVYYGVMNAKRQHSIQSIMIFDLGGISHFAGTNQFPVDWTPAEEAMLIGSCYQPTMWDIYWRLEPCEFVMNRIEKQKGLFGTPVITRAWISAILHHPIAYLIHRSAFMWNFMAGDNLGMWTDDLDSDGRVFPDRPAFSAMVAAHDALKPTPLMRAGFWLLICVLLLGLDLRRRSRDDGFVVGVCGSAALYVLSFYPVGVASDFRYAWWAVLAVMAGGVVLLADDREPVAS